MRIDDSGSLFADTQAARLRRELYGILALEAVQRTIAIGALLAIAVHAAAFSEDPRIAIVIVLVVALALTHLASAFRLRAGADGLRRDLHLTEAGAEVEAAPSSGPYRSTPVPVRPVAKRRSAHVSWAFLIGDVLAMAALTGAGMAALG